MNSSHAFTIVGKDVPVKDAEAKVTGSLKYATDFTVPGMVYGKILRSTYAHALIRKIDTSKVEALPGVLGVVTHKDAPEWDWNGAHLNYKGRILDDRVRFVGDEVAAVAAVCEDVAKYAISMIGVDYEPLPAVFDPEEAMELDAPLVTPEGNARKPNILTWGDVEQGIKESDIVAESSMEFGSQQQAPVGRNACIAEWTGDSVTIWTSTQTPSEFREAIAMGLRVPLNRVRVIALPCSCSFGLWWVNNFQLITALLAKKVRRPVKIELEQEECFSGVKRRHLERSKGRIGCRKDGTIVFIDVDHIFDNGGYGYKSDVYYTTCDLWGRSPHGRYVVQGTSTNLLTAGCMRGVGDLTLNAFVERLIDMAAMKLGIDPLEFRLKNHLRAGEPIRKVPPYLSQIPHFKEKGLSSVFLSSEGLHECLIKGADVFGWKRKWVGWGKPYAVDGPIRRAVGVGTAVHNCGVAGSSSLSAMIHIHADGGVTLCCNMGRQGQGSETTQAQIVAETLGIPFEQIEVIAGDTEACPRSDGSIACTAAFRTGFATWAACVDAKHQILEIAARHYLKAELNELDIKDGMIYLKHNPDEMVSLSKVLSQPVPPIMPFQGAIVGRPTVYMSLAGRFARHFAAHFVEVEVDTETGQIRLLNYVATQDSGTVLNPKVLENQIVGGAVAGSGFALVESLAFDSHTGKILNPNFLDYKVLRAPDFPTQPTVIFSKVHDPVGPYGAKGGGEGPMCAPLPAIGQAVYNAIGAWLDVPMTPERVLKALGKI